MKNQTEILRKIFAIIFLIGITFFITKYASDDIVKYLILIPVIIFVFNFLVRSMPSFKSYFLSPFNFISGKTVVEKQLDLPNEIAIEKFKEVLAEAGFKVKHVDIDKGTLMATSRLSWKSWGDNIYIEFDEKGVSKFYSVSIVGAYSWGKNNDNLRKLADTFESSLTV